MKYITLLLALFMFACAPTKTITKECQNNPDIYVSLYDADYDEWFMVDQTGEFWHSDENDCWQKGQGEDLNEMLNSAGWIVRYYLTVADFGTETDLYHLQY